jgi:hypothetical protein
MIQHIGAVSAALGKWQVRHDKRCVRNNTRNLAPIPNGLQAAVNLMATL